MWQAFLYTSQKGDIPIGVLKAVLYAHNTSWSLNDQSFFSSLIVFLICALFLNWRSQLGHWFADDMGLPLCEWLNTLSKEFWMLCYKSGHHHHWLSLEGIQSVKQCCFLKILSPPCDHWFYMELLLPISIRNQQQPICIDCQKKGEGSHEVDTPYVKNLNH